MASTEGAWDGTAAALRRATRDVHLAAEESLFIVDLMAGRGSIVDLARLTGQLRAVYEALESAVPAHRADPVLARLFDARLDRLAAIDRDLRELSGDAVATLTGPLPETAAYVERIHAIRDDAYRLVAHHYVRYLGDLSGGQIIATLMRRHYRLPETALTFYAFDDLPGKGGFKHEYRRALDELFARPGAFEAVVEEARWAYEANRRVFIALGGSSAGSRVAEVPDAGHAAALKELPVPAS